jgi:hypothetical protein
MSGVVVCPGRYEALCATTKECVWDDKKFKCVKKAPDAKSED